MNTSKLHTSEGLHGAMFDAVLTLRAYGEHTLADRLETEMHASMDYRTGFERAFYNVQSHGIETAIDLAPGMHDRTLAHRQGYDDGLAAAQ